MHTDSSSRSLLSLVMTHELRLLAANGSLWLVATLFLGLVSYGLASGITRINNQDAELAGILREQEDRVNGLAKSMKAIYAGTEKPDLYLRADSPSWVGGSLGALSAVMPTAPLAPLALGQSDLLPDSFKVSSYDKTTFMFNDPLQNPWHLVDGHFDLAFVMVYLLPLLVIALSYNLLSAEREDGTLKLLLAEPLTLGTLVLGKIVTRAAVLLVFALPVPLVALAYLRGPLTGNVLIDLLIWAILVTLYALLWFALAIWVNTWGKSSATNGIILCSVWAALVFVVPVLLNVVVAELHPMPSRVELMTRVRDLVVAARKRYGDMNTEDYHPELKQMGEGKVFIQGYQKVSWLSQKEIKPQTEAILSSFDEQLAKQQDAVDNYRFLSPAIVAYEAMTDLAGTGVNRYRHFLRQVDAFHNRRQEFFFPLVAAETRLTEAHYQEMPRFEWQEENRENVRHRALIGLLGLTAPTILILMIAGRRLRHFAKA